VIEHDEIVEIMAGHRDPALAPEPRFEQRERHNLPAAVTRSEPPPDERPRRGSRSKPPPGR
jgi:hypothetical protein